MATLSEDPSCTATSSQCYTQLRKEGEETFLKRHVFRVLYLNEIPGAMDKMKWPVSAAMMRHWFENPAWHMPENERGEIITVIFTHLLYMLNCQPQRLMKQLSQ